LVLLHPIPLLLLTIVGVLTALIIWGFWQIQSQKSDGGSLDFDSDNLQLCFFALAIFALGVLVTYLLFIFMPG
jgi:hypothetical protein